MEVDLKHNLATLTTINELAINRLFDKVPWCISDAIESAVLAKDDIVNIDLGYGTLSIKINENDVAYKFKPSKVLDKTVINTIVNGNNELTLAIESNLVHKLTNIYKELF